MDSMDSEKLFFNFLQLPNPQINAIEWSCSLLHDIAILPLWFGGWPPSDSQCLETFTLKPSNDVIHFVLIMEVWSVFFSLISCRSRLLALSVHISRALAPQGPGPATGLPLAGQLFTF